MPATLETFALRFAKPSPPMAYFGKSSSIPFIKGTSRIPRADLARIAAGGAVISPFEFTIPQATQFGPVMDTGHTDWDAE